MTKTFTIEDIHAILWSVNDHIAEGYADKMEMRDLALLNWYIMLLNEKFRTECERENKNE